MKALLCVAASILLMGPAIAADVPTVAKEAQASKVCGPWVHTTFWWR
jgi:opacity protein-like surface antigen